MRRAPRAIAIGLGFLLAASAGAGGAPEPATLVFVGYPDPAERAIARLLRRLGSAWEDSKSGVRVKVRTGLSYGRARSLVLEERAAGLLISEELNEVRAYKGQTGREDRGYTELRLDRFIPVAARVVRSRDRVLARVRLGIATDRIPGELRDFLEFLASPAADAVIEGARHMEPAERREEPKRVSEVRYKYDLVRLEQPVLVY